jgi:hypothetical protein
MLTRFHSWLASTWISPFQCLSPVFTSSSPTNHSMHYSPVSSLHSRSAFMSHVATNHRKHAPPATILSLSLSRAFPTSTAAPQSARSNFILLICQYSGLLKFSSSDRNAEKKKRETDKFTNRHRCGILKIPLDDGFGGQNKFRHVVAWVGVDSARRTALCAPITHKWIKEEKQLREMRSTGVPRGSELG